jgi:chromosome segregation ATPase
MSDTIINSHTNEGMGDRKKQKAGLNSVRPDDITEQQFKDMAKELKLSQTDMFKHIFWSYIREQNNERRQLGLNLEAEINLIAKDLNSVLQHFKSISEKAQDTVISIKTNAEQTEKNLTLDIDTLKKKVDELSKRNEELEQANAAFNQVKDGLNVKIHDLEVLNEKKTDELKNANETIKSKDNILQELERANKNSEKEINKTQKEIDRLSTELTHKIERITALESNLKEIIDSGKEKDKAIKELEKQINSIEKSNNRLEQEIGRHQEEIKIKESNIKSLESSNHSLNDTLSQMNKLKEAEIASIVAKHQLCISELEIKINDFEEQKTKEIEQMKARLKTEYEADKKLAVANIKMELAEVRSKYSEILIGNARLKGNNT